MDSETRGSAGAIEAAHIAGQNARHLVLVLHPYKSDQMILNEPISQQYVALHIGLICLLITVSIIENTWIFQEINKFSEN